MTSDLEKMAGETPDQEPQPQIDGYRREKLFKIAKLLNKAWQLNISYQDDEWLVIAVFKIDGTIYEVVHRLDENTPAEHAELFKNAMANTLEEYQKKNRIITTIH